MPQLPMPCRWGGGYFYGDFQDANDVASLISCHYEQFIKFPYAASVFFVLSLRAVPGFDIGNTRILGDAICP